MKYIFTSLITGITVLALAFVGHNYVLDNREIFQNDLSSDVTSGINEYRITNNLAPVIQNPIVCDLAIARAVEVSKDFSHTLFLERFNNPSYWKYFNKATFGENISRRINTGEEVVNAWINSTKHKEILDSEFEYGCVVCHEFNCVFNTIKSEGK